jgi:N-acetylmuramoyl-L-alanine amidase
MKPIFLFLVILVLFYGVLFAEPVPIQPENPIRIVHPAENAKLPALSSSFVFGSALPDGILSINGKPVPIHPGGGFLAMVDLTPGEFQIKAELRLGDKTYQLTRTIMVAQPEQPAPESPLTIEYITPNKDLQLLPGDYLTVVCKGSPGKIGFFSIRGVKGNFPMTESKAVPGGIYHGAYRIGKDDQLKKSRIEVTLQDKSYKKSKKSSGTVSLFSTDIPVMAEVITPNTVLKAGPALSQYESAGYLMFPPVGTLLQITGSIGDEYRVRLSERRTVWVNKNQVKLLPKGALPNRAVAGNISLSMAENSTFIRVSLDRKLPFQIVPDTEGKYIDISFYGAYSNTDWITNAVTGAVKQLQWFQDDQETYRLRIDTIPNSWWGYDARYEDQQFVLELRTPPAVKVNNSPLQDLIIAIDPGHSADTGAVGPTGYAEKDANLAQALVLKEKLLAKGAKVIMTRVGDEDVPLSKRTQIAQEAKADLLISIHNNALPYSGNPFEKRGFGVYYFTPMSLPLAREIHEAYVTTFSGNQEFNLPNDGLFYGNLALTRSPQMPSALIESAYMIVPEEEAYLKTEAFRSVCANAIITGMERYLRQIRPFVTMNKANKNAVK